MTPPIKLYQGRKRAMRDELYASLGDDQLARGLYFRFAYLWMGWACNSRCRYCYQDGGESALVWSPEKAHGLVDTLLADGFVVHPIVSEWVQRCWPLLAVLQRSACREISTNGLVIAQRHDAFLPLLHEHEITDIRFSLFPAGLHEHYTGRSRSIALESMRLAKAAGFRLVVNFVVTRDTLPHIDDFCEEALNLGVREIQFMNFIQTNRAAKMAEVAIDDEGIARFWDRWQALVEDPRFEHVRFDLQANFGPCPVGDNIFKRAAQRRAFCLAGQWRHGRYLYITPNDDIFPCAMLTAPALRMGRVLQHDGRWTYELHEQCLEDHVPGFDRSTCAALQLARCGQAVSP